MAIAPPTNSSSRGLSTLVDCSCTVLSGPRPARAAAAHSNSPSCACLCSTVRMVVPAVLTTCQKMRMEHCGKPLRAAGEAGPADAGSAAGATDTAAITSSVGQESVLAGALPAGWDRWRAVAADEGLTIDAMLQQKLVMMESVAASAGRELSEATVRAFMRRSAASSMVK